MYWYFTFTNVEKQKVSNFLCSSVADICSNRRDTPKALQDAYDRANCGRQEPTHECMMAMLKEVATGFENIYLFMDGLDECPKSGGERDRLLSVIHEIYGWEMGSLHILATSRRETDIEESIQRLDRCIGSFAVVGVQGAHVEQDIKKYIQHRLQDRVFLKWKPILKRDVEAKLTSQADGMYVLNFQSI